jgi:predicted Zn-dependent protease
MNKKSIFFIILLFIPTGGFSLDITQWLKQLGQQRGTKKDYKFTSVAAVRGLEEPSQMDPKARNFEAIQDMENYTVPKEILDQFIMEGKLILDYQPLKSVALEPVPPASAPSLSHPAISKEAKKASQPISSEEEISIGREVAANVAAQFDVVQDDLLTAYVNLVGLTVLQSIPEQKLNYRFALLDTPQINAFATPGGYIFITKGLLYFLKDEAQLACVLAHEIVHIHEKHVLKEIQKARLVDATIPHYLKASARQALWMSQVTDLAIQTLWKGLEKEDEFESDQLAISLARNAGYDAYAYEDVLKNLQSKAEDSNEKKDLKFMLSTHPRPQDRILAIQKQIHIRQSNKLNLKERFNQYTKR